MPRRQSQLDIELFFENVYEERLHTDLFFVPDHIPQWRGWSLIAVAHTVGWIQCEECDHRPIRRIFFTENTSGLTRRMICWSCARGRFPGNRLTPVVNHYNREMRNVQRQRDRQLTRAVADELWEESHMDVIDFLGDYSGTDAFLISLRRHLETEQRLLPYQVEHVRSEIAAENARGIIRGTTPRFFTVDNSGSYQVTATTVFNDAARSMERLSSVMGIAAPALQGAMRAAIDAEEEEQRRLIELRGTHSAAGLLESELTPGVIR